MVEILYCEWLLSTSCQVLVQWSHAGVLTPQWWKDLRHGNQQTLCIGTTVPPERASRWVFTSKRCWHGPVCSDKVVGELLQIWDWNHQGAMNTNPGFHSFIEGDTEGDQPRVPRHGVDTKQGASHHRTFPLFGHYQISTVLNREPLSWLLPNHPPRCQIPHFSPCFPIAREWGSTEGPRPLGPSHSTLQSTL